jgi:hypothetical protein
MSFISSTKRKFTASENNAFKHFTENNLLLLDMADEEDLQRKKSKGSVQGHSVINRDRVAEHKALVADYFCENPVYNDRQFRRRFRMNRPLYEKIVHDVENADPYFQFKRCRAGKPSFTPLQKVTAAIRQLAYGICADGLDEYLRMSESTSLESLKRFCKSIIKLYSEEYLRSPTQDDIDRLLARSEERLFPGMLGSIDCMH